MTSRMLSVVFLGRAALVEIDPTCDEGERLVRICSATKALCVALDQELPRAQDLNGEHARATAAVDALASVRAAAADLDSALMALNAACAAAVAGKADA